jgi:hypothetical protein
MPVMMPILMLTCLAIGQIPIQYLATPWFGERFASILGFEYGCFVFLTAVPYVFFVHPILHRIPRSQSSCGYRFAPKTWKVVCGFALFSAIIPFGRTPIALWMLVSASWLCFAAIYHWVLCRVFRAFI